jgi:hypothetical protein
MMGRTPLTEEEKKARAEARKASKTAITDAIAESEEEIREEASHKETAAAPPIVQVVTPQAQMVKILYVDTCIPGNQIPISKGRFISGSGRVFSVTLEEFEGEFMTPFHMGLLEKRKFIVLDGLTDEQRAQYHCDYAEGEVVRNEGMFDWFFSLSEAEAVNKFRQLCPQHRELVARRFLSAFESGDNRVDRSRVEKLNEAAKELDGKKLFAPIIQELNSRAV